MVTQLEIAGVKLDRQEGLTHFHNTSWRDLEFQDCDLSDAKFFKGSLTNCRFEKCDLTRTGFWELQVNDVRLSKCKLRDSAPGGIDTMGVHIPNRFERVSFVRCDLRGSAHSCETYTDCIFSDCRLDRVDFHGAVFANCRFEGRLSEVMFRSIDPTCPEMPPNHLANCDFSKARLEGCSFVQIDLDKIILPEDPRILFLPKGPDDLRAWRVRLGKSDYFLEYLIDGAGQPSLIEKSLLDGYTSEQVSWLEEIAAGRWPA